MGWFPTLDQAQALLKHLAENYEIERIGDIPDGMVAVRRGKNTAYFNFTESSMTLQISGGPLEVPPRDLRIVKKFGMTDCGKNKAELAI